MFIIKKEFAFSAAHSLPQCPDGHPCKRLHGHNYTITLHLASKELDDLSFVHDFTDLKKFKAWVDSELDHRNLNDVIPGPTTVEFMSQHIYALWKPTYPKLFCVEMSETPKTSCMYYEGDGE